MQVSVMDVVVGGLLMGGIYAIIAAGLSLQYGVARILNIAHGEFIMVGAFITFTLTKYFGIDPLVTLAICGPATFVLGYLLHRFLYDRIRATAENLFAFEGSSLLASFGLLFIIQNTALQIWGGDIRGFSYMAYPVEIFGAKFAANRLVTLGFALAIGLVFFLFLSRTKLGKGIRAASQDKTTAGLMGVNITQVLAICFGLGALMAGLAGTLLSMSYSIQPTMGMEYTFIALIVVVLGGLGSIPGSFIGGFLLGVIGTIISYWQPGLALVAYYVIFMLLLVVRPSGILGKG